MRFHKLPCAVALLILIYPSHIVAQQDVQEPSAASGRRGVPANTESIERTIKSAEQGNIFAQRLLGWIYASGRGVAQDYIQAYMWLTLAREGFAYAADNASLNTTQWMLDSFTKQMTSQQIEEAKRLAKEWESKNVRESLQRTDGGMGGGGGGKGEQAPPATGRVPEAARVQLVAPDPTDPVPLAPAEDWMSSAATVVMPIDIPVHHPLPIGSISAPPNYSRSSGSGSGGGIGTGVGSGTRPGVGPGSGGGGGIGSGGGPYVAGNGVTAPVAIVQPIPAYTEEARKAQVEGIVMIQAIIRRNGTVDSFKVIGGLGFGLEESAIQTIASKWRFKPGTLNGVPVDVQVNIEVSFKLRDK